MNYYSRAIQILGSTNEQNALSLLFKIAASNPAAIVNAVDGSPADRRERAAAEPVLTDLEHRCLDLLSRGKKIDAIKEWRAQTGMMMKEAKDAVELLAERRVV